MTTFLVVVWAALWRTAVIAVVFGFAEHAIHRYTMHKKVWGLHWSYKWHHEQHHAKQMNQAHEHLDILLAPYLIVFAVGSLFGLWRVYCGHMGGWAGIVSLGLVLTAHRLLWNSMHRCMHDTEKNWSMRLPWYKSFKRHHLEHHRHSKCNFGVVFPFVDRLLGTKSSDR